MLNSTEEAYAQLMQGSIPVSAISEYVMNALSPLIDSGILKLRDEQILVAKPAMFRQVSQISKPTPVPTLTVSASVIDAAAGVAPELSRATLEEIIRLALEATGREALPLAAFLRSSARYHPAEVANELPIIAMRLERFS